MWKRFFDSPPEWHVIVAAVIPTVILAWIGARIADGLPPQA